MTFMTKNLSKMRIFLHFRFPGVKGTEQNRKFLEKTYEEFCNNMCIISCMKKEQCVQKNNK